MNEYALALLPCPECGADLSATDVKESTCRVCGGTLSAMRRFMPCAEMDPEGNQDPTKIRYTPPTHVYTGVTNSGTEIPLFSADCGLVNKRMERFILRVMGDLKIPSMTLRIEEIATGKKTIMNCFSPVVPGHEEICVDTGIGQEDFEMGRDGKIDRKSGWDRAIEGRPPNPRKGFLADRYIQIGGRAIGSTHKMLMDAVEVAMKGHSVSVVLMPYSLRYARDLVKKIGRGYEFRLSEDAFYFNNPESSHKGVLRLVTEYTGAGMSMHRVFFDHGWVEYRSGLPLHALADWAKYKVIV